MSYPQKEFTINVYEADGVTPALGVSVTAYYWFTFFPSNQRWEVISTIITDGQGRAVFGIEDDGYKTKFKFTASRGAWSYESLEYLFTTATFSVTVPPEPKPISWSLIGGLMFVGWLLLTDSS